MCYEINKRLLVGSRYSHLRSCLKPFKDFPLRVKKCKSNCLYIFGSSVKDNYKRNFLLANAKLFPCFLLLLLLLIETACIFCWLKGNFAGLSCFHAAAFKFDCSTSAHYSSIRFFNVLLFVLHRINFRLYKQPKWEKEKRGMISLIKLVCQAMAALCLSAGP